MKCTCPKCHANIEPSLPAGAANGGAVSCPACNAKFNVMLESFAGRVSRRSGEIFCSACGNPLGPEIHCTDCGIPYPDYWVAGGRRKEAGGKGFNLKLSSSPFRKQQPAANVDVVSLEAAMRDQAPAAAPKKKAASALKSYNKPMVLGTLVVLVLLVAVGAAIYSRKKAETTYMKTFVRVAYGIQVGEDSSRKICQRIASDWKAKMDAGQNYIARPTPDEEKEISLVRTRLDSIKANLPAEPEQFKNSAGSLAKLEGSYNKLRALALAPGNSLPAFTDSINRLDSEYNKNAGELKAALPKKLMDELNTGAQKFRGLRPLLKAG